MTIIHNTVNLPPLTSRIVKVQVLIIPIPKNHVKSWTSNKAIPLNSYKDPMYITVSSGIMPPGSNAAMEAQRRVV
jgi:hypothetical protein